MINSKIKGKVGELEASKFLTERGFPAYRSQQFKGAGDAADVRFEEAALNAVTHIEVKRDEALNVHKALTQAKKDRAQGQYPIVMHRKNSQEWMVTVDAEDFWEIFKVYWKAVSA